VQDLICAGGIGLAFAAKYFEDPSGWNRKASSLQVVQTDITPGENLQILFWQHHRCLLIKLDLCK
jgi:hypothetical protein